MKSVSTHSPKTINQFYVIFNRIRKTCLIKLKIFALKSYTTRLSTKSNFMEKLKLVYCMLLSGKELVKATYMQYSIT